MNSIGLVEVKNVSKGIVVTDEMLKSAGIVLITVSYTHLTLPTKRIV